MNILFYTTDLFSGREHLMPWRTIIEVAKKMQNHGHNVIIINGVSESKHLQTYTYQNIPIQGINKKLNKLAYIAKCTQANALFMECKWRDAIKGFRPLKRLTCKKYVYFTGGVYDLQSTKLLSKLCGVIKAKAYWMEVFIPKSLIGYRLRQAKFDGSIGLSPFSTYVISKSGCPNAVTILPGKDTFAHLQSNNYILQKYQLNNKRFLCFTGAPAPTRGAQLLLQAVDKVKVNDLRVVFLMRTDIGSEFEVFDNTYKQMRHPERVIIVKEHLTREQLKAFFEQAMYMVLPFIVIPSEIPLTFFEIMSCGTPILTFKNGGTSEYLKEGLLIAEKSINGLTIGITEAWTNQTIREKKAKHAKRLMDIHPTWETVGQQWMNLIESKNNN